MTSLRKPLPAFSSMWLAAALCALASVPPAIGGTLVLQPGSEGKDAGVQSASPGTNYGATEWFNGIGIPSYGVGFVAFDVSSIPPGSLVLSADIALWAEYRDGTLTLGPSVAPWDEMTVTWSNQPGVVSPSMDVTYPISRGDPAGSCYWGCVWPFDITDIVQYWVDHPTSNYGLRILGDTPGVGWLMASSDNLGYPHPMLTVQYDLATAVHDNSWGKIKHRYR